VDPISCVIKSAGSPIHCNVVAPPRYKVDGKWYCSYPELKECHDPEMLPVDEVRIDPVKVNDIGLGKSIYTKEQLEEFARFQDSQGPRKAYMAETAEMAYTPAATRRESAQITVSVPDLVSRIRDVVLVRRIFNSGKPRGVRILEWGGNEEGMGRGWRGEISLRAAWDQGGQDPLTSRRVSK
jgi:hypothetical protein